MFERKNSILFMGAGLDACAMWRQYFPHLNLPGSSWVCFGNGTPNMQLVAGHDIIAVQRMCSKGQLDFLRICKSMGLKIIYDLDDLVYDLPGYNPAKVVFDQARQGFQTVARVADVISVSTRKLAEALPHFIELKNPWTNKEIPIVITENKMDARVFAPPVKGQREHTIVGWSGSTSHVGDLVLVQDAIKAIKREIPKTQIQFRGCVPPTGLNGLVEFVPWTPVPEFGSRMPTWDWDIGLAPLVEHHFNSAKSAIKIYESAYSSIPVLASWIAPYDDFYTNDSELRWLLCANAGAWKRKLRTLVQEPELRKYYGARANKVLHERYLWSRGHEGWRELIKTARDI